MNERGSAYIFVLVMTMSMLLMLAVAANISSYEAQVSTAYRNHSNLSLLAHTGAERAVCDINSELHASRARIAEAAAARMDADGDYISLFVEEAGRLMTERFADSEIVYSLTLPAEGSQPGDSYTVTVRITAAGGGLGLISTAAKDGLATGEKTTATAVLTGDATADIYEGGHNITVVTGDIEYRIEKMKQNR